MTFDLVQIIASKKARRQTLAQLPYSEKLRILEEMFQRDRDLRSAKPCPSKTRKDK